MKLEVKGLSAGYMQKLALRQVDFTVQSGQVLCVLGPNGGGKSTLFRTLLGLMPREEGEILVDGEEIRRWKPSRMAQVFSYIPQNHEPTFDYRVLDVVLMGRTSHLGLLQSPGKADEHIAMEALQHIGAGYLAQRSYTALSGGERRLVLIARALCQQAQFLVMDEPTSDLDFVRAHRIFSVIRQLAQEGRGVILSTHAPDLPLEPEDRLLLLGRGRSVAFGSVEQVLTPEYLQQAYGAPIEVLEARDSSGRVRRVCVAAEKGAVCHAVE